uniref:Uncharacterized protein n=1 Tax=Chromera velia CCMP2878 TaxID=1169474 RepID=A0A0G4HW91_9ALVE|eukprot:Cvel_8984.t1-p1 / transcript=Cvel_8984.t1 / gene=Cvel_8984 / organism=Chromera_velia_CCMP2878 / gene_product=hypothetical protein / transcript_product=hypothetical protein / location=Cvel_scaffold507:21163-23565(+) / protein_length=402 / sequence_SO=supercontig / SO=protein_coding / is_pseudo=false
MQLPNAYIDEYDPKKIPGAVMSNGTGGADGLARLVHDTIGTRNRPGVCKVLNMKGFETTSLVGFAQTRAMRANTDPAMPPMDVVSRFDAMGALRSMFRKGKGVASPLFFFFYAGHGEAPRPEHGGAVGDPRAGALLMQRDPGWGEREKLKMRDNDGLVVNLLTFDDILSVWRAERRSLDANARFVIMADSCFSGSFAVKLREASLKEKHLNMAVQSAGNVQPVKERSAAHGGHIWSNGELTSWWIAKNTADRPGGVRWSSTKKGRQWPQYFATWLFDGIAPDDAVGAQAWTLRAVLSSVFADVQTRVSPVLPRFSFWGGGGKAARDKMDMEEEEEEEEEDIDLQDGGDGDKDAERDREFTTGPVRDLVDRVEGGLWFMQGGLDRLEEYLEEETESRWGAICV